MASLTGELERENAELRAMLEAVQWSGYDSYGYTDCCPICLAGRPFSGSGRHEKDCRLAALLSNAHRG